jgi:branched-chain amino acid transport system substrate-binding protein
VAAYSARFGALPDHRAALAYDAATLIGRAVHEVGADRRRVRDWVAEVGRGRAAHAGVTGEIRFDEDGNTIGKSVVLGRIGS